MDQGQNLALTVVCVPYLLESGPTVPLELPALKLKTQQNTEEGLRESLASREQASPAVTLSFVEPEGIFFMGVRTFTTNIKKGNLCLEP